jgi:hypothetical protein
MKAGRTYDRYGRHPMTVAVCCDDHQGLERQVPERKGLGL